MLTEMFVCGVTKMSVKYGHVITCIKNYGRTIITVTLCDPARGHIMGGRRVRLGMTSCLCIFMTSSTTSKRMGFMIRTNLITYSVIRSVLIIALTNVLMHSLNIT